MSRYPQELGPIPAETMRVARAAYPKGSLAMRLRDELGGIYRDEEFLSLFDRRGQPAEAPWRLALVLVLQTVEGLTDRQAAEEVPGRIDWKYALGLELTDPGFDASVLSEFRTRLVEGQAEKRLLDRRLALCKQRGWLKAGGKPRTDSTHVLARARSLSNLECVGETLRAALNEIVSQAPDWLASQVSLQWVQRYGHRVENYRLPKADTQRTALAEQMGADGLHLLRALELPDAPAGLSELSSVQVLRAGWQQYYDLSDGRASWRGGPQADQSEGVVRSPYDRAARTGKKRELAWFGYKTPMTETCDAPTPAAPHPLHLVIQVQTTVANVQDGEQTTPLQQDLARAALLPSDQLVDTGYVDADLLVSSQQNYGIRLLGPVLSDNSWQAKADKGFDAAHLQVDWQQQTVTCPQGQPSHRWTPLQEPERIEIVFARTTCAACPCRPDCTRSQTTGRVLPLRPQGAYEALLARRQEQETPAFRQCYASRAGIEATLAQGVRAMGLREARYIGLQKTHLQQTLTAVAINVVRIDAFLTDTPQGQTRRSAFSALASHPALELSAA